jgi:N6-L-threonylcarbamoyladenine synthase
MGEGSGQARPGTAKVAQLEPGPVHGLGFPGGPAIDQASDGGDPDAVEFRRAVPERPYDFSFSGTKISGVTFVEKARESGDLPSLADMAASVQEAIVDVLVDKTFNAVDATEVQVAAGGGVGRPHSI